MLHAKEAFQIANNALQAREEEIRHNAVEWCEETVSSEIKKQALRGGKVLSTKIPHNVSAVIAVDTLEKAGYIVEFNKTSRFVHIGW